MKGQFYRPKYTYIRPVYPLINFTKNDSIISRIINNEIRYGSIDIIR